MKKLKILFLGPAGSGKGTQSARLAKKYEIQHISTGDLIRSEIKSGSELGNKVKAIVDAGELVSADIVNEIVKSSIANLDGFILDGYPRTLEQAEFIKSFVDFDYIFDLEVPEEILLERLEGRRMCTKTNDPKCKAVFHRKFNPPAQAGVCDLCGSELYQRKDDMPEAISRRLASYQEETGKPLNEFYGSKVTKIDGSQHPDAVFDSLINKVQVSV